MKMNQLRRGCYNRCCWKIRKSEVTRIRNPSPTLSNNSNALNASPRRKRGKLDLSPCLGGRLNLHLNSTPFALSLPSKRTGIGAFPSMIHSNYARNLYQCHKQGQQNKLEKQLRYHSSNIDDHGDGKNSFCNEGFEGSIAADVPGVMSLEKAAFVSKEIVERRFIRSIEMMVWKSSTTTERKKMYRFFFPQIRKASNDLLGATRDVDSLSNFIEKARENKGGNAAAESSLRELHRSFLQLTQIVLDNLDVAMESEKDQCEVSQDSSAHSLQMLELVLSLSYRTHQLGFGFHWPLYQRLAWVVATHPTTIGQKTPSDTSTTLGTLASQSRAEWIQTIRRWLRFDSGNDNNESRNQSWEDESCLLLERKREDATWFQPFLKVLATDGRWPDVYQILQGLLRPDTEPIVACGNFESNDFADDFDDPVVLTSAITVPYFDTDLVVDLLVPMDRQGLLRVLWNKRRRYPPSACVVKNIILLIEPSIWKIFHTISSHQISNVRHEDMDYTAKYSLEDAISILLKCGSSNVNIDHDVYEDGTEYLVHDGEEESLIKALSELEDILDEHLDLGDVGDGEKDEINPTGLDAIALATALTNEMRHEGAQDKRTNKSVHFDSLNAEKFTTSFDESEARVSRSYNEHGMEMTSLNKRKQSTENTLDNSEGEEYLGFIYDDRAVNFQDNIPDITKQIYQSNGNQQLRYSTAFENQIFEGLHRSNLHYENEDDFVI